MLASAKHMQRLLPRASPAALESLHQLVGRDVSGQAEAANKVFARDMSSLPVTYTGRGAGGRHSISGITATVFGSTGMLGRYVVNHLGKSGSKMILPTRCNDNARQHLRVMGDLGQLVLLDDFSIHSDDAIKYAIERSNVVINLVGREWETRNFSFEDVHVKFPKRLAEIAAEVGVDRLIHCSALGASTSHPSAYYKTKAEGDAEVRAAFPSATIIKPAKLLGTEDRILNVFAEHAVKFPLVPVIDDGSAQHQPVFVDDVGLAVRALVHDPETAGKEYELCGEKVYTMEDLAKLAIKVARVSNSGVGYFPSPLAKLLATPHEILLKRVPFPLPTPLGLTYSYINAQSCNYLKSPKSLGFKELGIEPVKLEGYVIDYLRAYRSGGYDTGATAGASD